MSVSFLSVSLHMPNHTSHSFCPRRSTRCRQSSAIGTAWCSSWPYLMGYKYQNYNRMKITAELIQQSPQFTNPLNERQLDLRGYKISGIENMGATLNFFECIDLSDNELRKLGNFSYLDRLTSLILTNNRIKQLSDLS